MSSNPRNVAFSTETEVKEPNSGVGVFTGSSQVYAHEQ